MAKFRKRPVVIEAAQLDPWGGGASAELEAFLAGADWEPSFGGGLSIQTLEGRHRASPGDWIIRGVKGEYYPCKPDVFAQTYEAAE